MEQTTPNVEEQKEMTPEMQERLDQINSILQADEIEPTTALNILINATQVSFDKEHFTDLDRFLISKALNCLSKKVEEGQDFLVKVS
jgi:hypothetical protein